MGSIEEFNPELDKAGRIADFMELAELMCKDALNEKKAGGHFREESQTDGEAKRDDDNFKYVAAWSIRK